MGLVCYVVIMVPLMIGFDWTPRPRHRWLGVPAIRWIGGCVDWLFVIDIFVNLNTSYLDERTKEVVADRGRIFRRYARGWMLIDVVSCLGMVRGLCV